MAKIRRPRHGSLQFWPRKKAKKPYAKVKSWVKSKNIGLLGFVGYKAGMTHVAVKDSRPSSLTKGDNIVWPVTVIECPTIKIFSLRFYKKTQYGLKVVFEIINGRLDKELSRKVKLSKKDIEPKLKDVSSKLDQFDDLRVCVYTQPNKTGIGKKKPEIFELGVGGNNVKEKFDYVVGLLGKEVRVSDVLKQGNKIDIHAVTRGKGFQGVVKRFGVHLMGHKTEKKRRTNIYGPTIPSKILWGMIMPGRMGFNLRTEYNKDVVFVGDKPEKVNPKGGFLHYGLVKNDYVLIKGSVPGHVRRLITMTESIRGTKGFGHGVELQNVSLESKQ
ncbi:50S ribosomal protein L3 [Candidatus Woesearchaeota archaeon]|nr:50S ribosomal protein L3 [Candidatus Woesearchaeota archaeon]